MHVTPKPAHRPPPTPSAARAPVVRTRRETLEMLPPGTQFGRYELLRRVAVGGMAELYLARATGIEGFEKLVALKRILPQNAENDDFVAMFLDEARLAATIQHANVAQVYDIGRCDDGLFFTMEYIHGEDVRSIMQALIKRGRGLPLEHALAMVMGACAGLHAAHEKRGSDGRTLGIVHRDVSPSNVLVSYDGCVKLIDFGIAKAQVRQTETRAGTLKGKISYMSPEQCMGIDLDRRSDVFSLGVLLYEITTGLRLFPVENEYAALRQIVDHDAPAPSQRKPGYPPELEAIVMRALRRERSERYASAEELLLDLEGFVRARSLAVSSAKLGYFMRELFPERAVERIEPRAVPSAAPTARASERSLPLRAPTDHSVPVPVPRTSVLSLDALPARAPTAPIDDLALPGEAPVGTWMFRADGTPPPSAALRRDARGEADGDEPSISIEGGDVAARSQVIGRGSGASLSIVDQALLTRQRRWHIAIAAGVAASISAVVAAVVVMMTRPPEAAPAITAPAPAITAPALAVPAPTEPAAVTPPVDVAAPAAAPDAAPTADAIPVTEASNDPAPATLDTRAPRPAASAPARRPVKAAPKAKPKARTRSWNPDSALPPM